MATGEPVELRRPSSNPCHGCELTPEVVGQLMGAVSRLEALVTKQERRDREQDEKIATLDNRLDKLSDSFGSVVADALKGAGPKLAGAAAGGGVLLELARVAWQAYTGHGW